MKLGLPPLLGLLFITLKLCGVISWSWWWVLSPFWITFLVVFTFHLIVEILKSR